jgi:hypothetical protein
MLRVKKQKATANLKIKQTRSAFPAKLRENKRRGESERRV